jgi:rhamnosyltransferase
MKVNIVLSTYNGAKFLAEQIESIQKQTFTDWQLLIRDDGSTDETPQIIEQFATADKRIKFINADNRENFGVIKNFFTLVKFELADYYFSATRTMSGCQTKWQRCWMRPKSMIKLNP